MNYNVFITDNFKKEFKVLFKKYPSLKADLQIVLDNLELENELKVSVDLGGGFKKIRIKINSKGKGKSGGGRIILYETIINVSESDVVFGSIYNKGDFNTIDISLLKKILNP